MEPTSLLCPWSSPGKITGMAFHSLLQGIFLTQGSNPRLLHCREILFCLIHQAIERCRGSEKIVEYLIWECTLNNKAQYWHVWILGVHKNLIKTVSLRDSMWMAWPGPPWLLVQLPTPPRASLGWPVHNRHVCYFQLCSYFNDLSGWFLFLWVK